MEHVPFNAGLLATCIEAFPDAEIYFYGESKHLRYIHDTLDSDEKSRIQFVSVEIPPRRAGYVERLLSERRLFNYLKNYIDKDSRSILICSAVEPSTILAMHLCLHPLQQRNITAIAILHSVLAQIAGWRSRNPFHRMFDLRSMLTWARPRNLTFVVLENSIKKEVIALIPNSRYYFSSLPHPINEAEISLRPRPLLREKPRIGYIGLASADRGFDIFLRVAEVVGKRAPGIAEFHAIGRRGLFNDSTLLSNLSRLPTLEKLDRSEYLKQVRDLDYVFLPLPEQYRLSASGALLDAIAAARPVIGTNLPIFEDIEIEHGRIGWFTNIEGLAEATCNLVLNPDRAGHSQRVSNLARVRSSRTPRSLGPVLRNIVERNGQPN